MNTIDHENLEILKEVKQDIISKIKKTEDKIYFDEFISDFKSREERHYCAYLFSWFITCPNAIKTYFESHDVPSSIEQDFNKINFDDAEVYYEYTGLRELLDLIERKVKKTSGLKISFKNQIEQMVFMEKKGDIQKKKPDLVFYFPKSQTIALVEAKFEGKFDENQIIESKKYGEVLKALFPEDIKNVLVSILGIDYYVNKIKSQYPSISWEKIHEILPDGNIKNEVKRGLKYQQVIHEKAMKNWKLTTSTP